MLKNNTPILDLTTLRFIYSMVIGSNPKEDIDTYLNYVGDDYNTIQAVNAVVQKCKEFKIKQSLLNLAPPSHADVNIAIQFEWMTSSYQVEITDLRSSFI